MDDQTAISRIKQGDLSGLESLVERYQARVVHAAYLIVYDRALAEDIVQAAFVKVAERVHQFDGERPFGPWFFRIVVNDALKAERRQRRSVPLEEPAEPSTLKLAAWLKDPAPPPGELAEEHELRQQILKAVKSLSPDQRAVVVMRYFLDMSEADMSTHLKRPLSTIKWWLRDARKHLRHLIEDYFMRGVNYE